MKYYKDTKNNVYVDPIVKNHDGLIEISKEEFDLLISPTQEELMAEAESKFTSGVEAFIQDEVEVLNAANGVKFSDIHNCKSFALTDGYFLQTECKAITDWAFLTVWEHMRLWQKTLTSIPTDAEFQAELDKIPFNG